MEKILQESRRLTRQVNNEQTVTTLPFEMFTCTFILLKFTYLNEIGSDSHD